MHEGSDTTPTWAKVCEGYVKLSFPNLKTDAQIRHLEFVHDTGSPFSSTPLLRRQRSSSTPLLRRQRSLQHIKASRLLYILYGTPFFQLSHFLKSPEPDKVVSILTRTYKFRRLDTLVLARGKAIAFPIACPGVLLVS